MEYRRNINALRAISVVAIMILHFYPALMPGAYVGIDIFFVISGFLTTGIIITSLHQNDFSLASFCLSRIKRIAPALRFLCLSLMIFGWHSFDPDLFAEVGKHTLGALRSHNNSQGDSEHISQVLFNYMGMWEKTLTSDSMFRFDQLIKTSYGHNHHGYLITCNAMIFAQQLETTFEIDMERLGISAEQFNRTFENKLTALIDAGMNDDLSGFTPSDFPSADVNQQDLDDIFAEFGEE